MLNTSPKRSASTRIRVIAAIAGFALTVAACSDDDAGTDTSPDTTEDGATPATDATDTTDTTDTDRKSVV